MGSADTYSLPYDPLWPKIRLRGKKPSQLRFKDFNKYIYIFFNIGGK